MSTEFDDAPEADAPQPAKSARTPRAVAARFQRPQPAREPARDEHARGEQTAPGRLTRRRRSEDPFALDPTLAPDGWSYEWKAVTIHGAPQPEHVASLRENHWRPVPTKRHPHLMPTDTNPDAPILRKGQMLMERPAYLTEDARQEDIEIAQAQIDSTLSRISSTPQGHFTRAHPSARAVTNVTHEREGTPLHIQRSVGAQSVERE